MDFELKSLPMGSGVSLKPEHFSAAEGVREAGLWFEVHPENYFVQGGPRLSQLESIAEKFPISLHGIAASLAGPELIPSEHLTALKNLCDRVQPACVSEHLAWSFANGHYLGNLLPAPRTAQVRSTILANIDLLQTSLGRQILIENPAHYLAFSHEFEEPEFMLDIAQQSGAGLLLDLNNLYISQVNIGMDANRYLEQIDLSQVGEIHVAAHQQDENEEGLLIDSHDGPVSTEVWQLLDRVFCLAGPKPVLVEWDTNLPSFDTLMAEQQIAATKIRQGRDLDVA